MSVRELERLARAAAVGGAGVSKAPATDPRLEARLAVLADLQRQIGQSLGTKATIRADRKGKNGRIVLEFYGLDHFDSLLNRLGVRPG
jgi:predicted N-acetyltransferase YhbS